jgi:hypothetical protein
VELSGGQKEGDTVVREARPMRASPGAREPRRDRGEVLLDQRAGDRVNGDVPTLMRLGVLADFSTPLTT